MTWVDVVILIIIISLIVHGIITGLIRGIFDIIGIVGGYILAVRYAPLVKIPRFLGILLIFFGVVIVVSITGRIISKLIHYTPLGAIDRLFGGILGFIKGVIISFIFLIIVLILNKGDVINRSELAPVIFKTGITASQILPEQWHRWLESLTEKKDLVNNRKCYASDYIPL